MRARFYCSLGGVQDLKFKISGQWSVNSTQWSLEIELKILLVAFVFTLAICGFKKFYVPLGPFSGCTHTE
jgi:hypothetical protein